MSLTTHIPLLLGGPYHVETEKQQCIPHGRDKTIILVELLFMLVTIYTRPGTVKEYMQNPDQANKHGPHHAMDGIRVLWEIHHYHNAECGE